MLRFQASQVSALHRAARSEVETCFTGISLPLANGHLVHELAEVPESAYVRRTASQVSLRPEYCIELAARARKAGPGAGVVLAHTHVGKDALNAFSSVDDAGETPLHQYLEHRVQGAAHFSCVATEATLLARPMPCRTLVDTAVVGQVLVKRVQEHVELNEIFDRQVRAFGDLGQRALQALQVCIVGLGGTGSVVAQQLAHLGVNQFVLIDPDEIETTNLNRVVGATRADVGRAKVAVAAETMLRISPRAQIKQIRGDVRDADAQKELQRTDFIFCCTDSMASRAIINLAAYAYYVPCIDMGVSIGARVGGIQHVAGRVQYLAPGCACLVCTEKLDHNQVRQELLSDAERAADPYITGARVPQPAVISLNSTVASASVSMFLAAVAGVPSAARMLSYNGMSGAMKPLHLDPRPGCVVCSEDGAMGLGASCALPRRAKVSHE